MRRKSITDRYRWLIKRFQKEFGKKYVRFAESDYGYAFGIGVDFGAKRLAFRVEGSKRIQRITKKGVWSKYRYWNRFSLNELDTCEKQGRVQAMIKHLRSL